MNFCAIDFGTSNSAIAVPHHASMRLVPVEDQAVTLPTAVFFNTDEESQAYGRAAIEAYIDGYDGRLMRSMKSILGSALADSTTELGDGSAIRYVDVITLFVQHLKQKAEAAGQRMLERVVMGRPVYFVDDDPVADRLAQSQLEAVAKRTGFREVEFQYEPIAAAFDYEARLDHEQLVLVADIGGGTSDFSLVRVGPERAKHLNRKSDVLAHHGVHVAGTDYDKRVELEGVLTRFGYKSLDPSGKEVPNRIYYDLATWHLINTVYTPRRAGEFALLRHLYADPAYHRRLMAVIERRLGHALAARAEDAKIAVSAGGASVIELDDVEPALEAAFDNAALIACSLDETRRIVDAAHDTVRMAGMPAHRVDALYFTGGSTGLGFLTDALGAAFPNAKPVIGDRLASVATGLGIHARRLFDPA
ncbi:Hsp70 family protein [Pararobbsia silviterrae]|uniref:Hsp70 family protein n=1 Tax=Pararobbsia silviterrae TaxID=1792498 RepID=A0A494X5V4_9BURK|nr:Hsp70 family protein [Pararobbsia silviterrae]RKP45760.1 Hsp70 family protein [Pararobbsia silviterrae]